MSEDIVRLSWSRVLEGLFPRSLYNTMQIDNDVQICKDYCI